MNNAEIIEFAFQNWNVEYGWWCPNTVPADFIYNGVKHAPFTHGTQWFDLGKDQYHTNKISALNAKVIKNDFLYYHGNVKYIHLSSLKGKKYIFPVLIKDISYFRDNRNYGFDFVDPVVFEDVRANRARIVLFFPLEGTSGADSFKDDLEILNSWCVKYNLTKDQVYYVHGNFKTPELAKDFNFTAIPINHFICWVPGIRQHTTAFNPVDGQDLFLSYNRRPRPHRTLLMCELIRSKILDRGLVSYYGDNVKNSVNRVKLYNRPGLEPEALILDSMIPKEIDMDLGLNNPASNIVEEHYNRTFCSVVPETLDDSNVIFFSEKTWKTIAVGHPFMLLSSPGMLKALREMGYYTYGAWWDEGYDVIKNRDDRVRHIVNELKRLSAFPREQLINMRTSMQPVIEHNQLLFNQQWTANCFESENRQLYRIVENIWNSF